LVAGTHVLNIPRIWMRLSESKCKKTGGEMKRVGTNNVLAFFRKQVVVVSGA
jgi:hypothetical protein